MYAYGVSKLIGFCGYAGAGKTTAARALLRNMQPARILSFAAPLKAMIRALGVDPNDRKEEPHPLLCGKSPRHAMQTLGTDWGRELIGDELWLRSWAHRYERTRGTVIVDDVRFQNEADLIRAYGGVLVRVDRLGAVQVGQHPSELIDFEHDLRVMNPGDERLTSRLLELGL